MTSEIRRRVTHDPTDPNYPHGTSAGYRRTKHQCEQCKQAHARAAKRQRTNRARVPGANFQTSTPPAMAKVRAHITMLTEQVPGLVYSAIGRAAGINHCIPADVMARPERKLRPVTARAILNVTAADVRAAYAFEPRPQIVLLVRQMQALGYPLPWQSKQIGYDVRHTVFDSRDLSFGVRAPIAAAVRALHARIGDTVADPTRDGIDKRAVTNCKKVARRNGVYPPACYNDDGTLDYRSVPGHPWSADDDMAHRRMDVLRLLLSHENHTTHTIATRVGVDPRTINRAVERSGIAHYEPRRAKRVAWLAKQLEAFDASAGDPVRFVLDTDLIHPSKLQHDHPALVQWMDANPNWQDLVDAGERGRARRKVGAFARYRAWVDAESRANRGAQRTRSRAA